MSQDRLLVAHARIIDGSGAPPFGGSVIVERGRIAEVSRDDAGPLSTDARVIDAGGRVLSPGFIDVHNHSDVVPFVEPWMDSALRQGSTTLVVGNCGASPWPPAGAPELAVLIGVAPEDLGAPWATFADYLDRVEAARPAVNVAALVGHGALRLEAVGPQRRPPTGDEVDAMRRMAAEAMEAGAVGLSTGLIYVPGMYASTDEVVAVAEATTRSSEACTPATSAARGSGCSRPSTRRSRSAVERAFTRTSATSSARRSWCGGGRRTSSPRSRDPRTSARISIRTRRGDRCCGRCSPSGRRSPSSRASSRIPLGARSWPPPWSRGSPDGRAPSRAWDGTAS